MTDKIIEMRDDEIFTIAPKGMSGGASAEMNEPKIITDDEITALTNKFIEARDALHTFAAWPFKRFISPEEINRLKDFPTGKKLEYLIRVACQVEQELEHLRGKQAE